MPEEAGQDLFSIRGDFDSPGRAGGGWRATHTRRSAERLPPRVRRVFLPPDTAPAAASFWIAWDPSQTTIPRPAAQLGTRWRKPRVVGRPAGAQRPDGGIGCQPGARPLSPTVVRPGTVEVASRRRTLWADHARCGGGLGYRQGAPLADHTNVPMGGAFLVRCGLLYRHGQGEEDRLCIPAGGELRAKVPSVPLRQARWELWASQDGVAGAAPCLKGGKGRRRRRVRALVPAHQGGARRPVQAPPSPAAALAEW